MESLHTKYRPTSFDEVVGHAATIASIRTAIKGKRNHAFLLTGPAGVGKTTIARILATESGCDEKNLMEVDAATRTGVDDVRDIQSFASRVGLGKSKTRFVILDEAHMLSKAAWNSLLKIVEEPPAHLFWAFCTTEAGKVPETIRSRCLSYDLGPVSTKDLTALLDDVAKQEKLDTPDEIIDLCVSAADGSPRAALVALAKVSDCEDEREARILLRHAGETTAEVLELCRALISSKTGWKDVTSILQKMPDANPESVRIQVASYMSKVLVDPKGKTDLQRVAAVLEEFGIPYPSHVSGTMYPLVRSLSRLLLV